MMKKVVSAGGRAGEGLVDLHGGVTRVGEDLDDALAHEALTSTSVPLQGSLDKKRQRGEGVAMVGVGVGEAMEGWQWWRWRGISVGSKWQRR